jgi:hypothetical protein
MKSELLAGGTDAGLRRHGDGLAPNLRGRGVVDRSLNRPGLSLKNLNYRLEPVS